MTSRAASERRVTIGLVQMRARPTPGESLDQTISGVREAAARGATVVCLQELFLTPYFCQTEDPAFFAWAEPVPGPTTAALGELARELGIALVGSLFERRAPGVYHNTAVVLAPDGSLAGMYRKMHIPDDPCFLEKYYFAPGDTGFISIETPFARVGPLVCWDQWYPEAARLTALRGAEVLFYPTAIGRLESESPALGEAQRDAWETVQRAHAIANGVFVAAVNRVGREGRVEFWGSSFIADPFGRVLARAGAAEEEVLVAECDLGLLERTRQDWPFLRDRRIDAYAGLVHRFLDARDPDAP